MARKNQMKEQMEEVAQETSSNEREKEKKLVQAERLMPTGSTLLNLSMTDNANGGFVLGTMNNIIGDKASGKTILSLTVLAMAAHDPRFDNYHLIYDDVENANAFDMEYMFGDKTAERIKLPYYNKDEGEREPSDDILDFQGNILDYSKSNEPFIYVLDSYDALSAKEDIQKLEDRVEAQRKGNKEPAGSYGMAKPRASSEILRAVNRRVKYSNSLLLIISQTRDAINNPYQSKTRSGGNALDFYSFHILWFSVASQIKKKERVIGNHAKVRMERSKANGKKNRVVDFPIYYEFGIDDLSSCIDFLIDEKFWHKPSNQQKIEAPEFGFIDDGDKDNRATKEKIIQHIESNNLEDELVKITQNAWNQIEDEIRPKHRKKRF